MTLKVRVVIADDQQNVRESLKGLLPIMTVDGDGAAGPRIEIVGEASDGESAVRIVAQCQPDVVLMDVRMAGMDGLQATRIIKARWPEVRVVILTLFAGQRGTALAAGADAFLLKGCSPEILARTIHGSESEMT
ncbi:MAG TPA: response regulator transcription factor [Ardenticatenaceae bacterium]|nr:response regulator transcription factor [Ardenticatenaceae bacterium]